MKSFHHTGCLVRNLDTALSTFAPLAAGPASEPILVSKQQVRVCFLPLLGGGLLELVCPNPEAKGLTELLDSPSPFYHLAFKVSNIDEAVDEVLESHYQIVTSFRSEAFDGAICTFVRSSEGALIEFIQEAHNNV